MNHLKNTCLRLASIADAEKIASVHAISWQKMYHDFIPEDILDRFSFSERLHQWEYLLSAGVTVILAEELDRTVGFVSICPLRNALPQHKHFGEISAIYVHPDYWRQGIGRQLCLAALNQLKKQDFVSVALWVLEANILARNFYEALGFTASNHTKLEEFYEGSALLKEILYYKSLF